MIKWIAGVYMKKLLSVLVVSFFSIISLFAADPCEGYWISYDDKSGKATAGWHIRVEGDILYGSILSLAGMDQDTKAFNCKPSYKGFPIEGKVNEMSLIGPTWIFGLKKEAEGVWNSGHVIDPESGGMYKCKMTFRKADGKKFKSDCLEMRGEIGLGIGRSQFWLSATKDEAAGLR